MHLTLGGYSPYYFFYGFGDYSIIIIIIIIVVDRGLACMNCFRPNAHSIPLISFTLALTIILMVGWLSYFTSYSVIRFLVIRLFLCSLFPHYIGRRR